MDSDVASTKSDKLSPTHSQTGSCDSFKEGCAETRKTPSFVSRILPRWVGQFAGQSLLRVCPAAHREEPCAGCELRAVCKCAQDDMAAAARVEKNVWALLAACGAAIILYCLI